MPHIRQGLVEEGSRKLKTELTEKYEGLSDRVTVMEDAEQRRRGRILLSDWRDRIISGLNQLDSWTDSLSTAISAHQAVIRNTMIASFTNMITTIREGPTQN
jgi:hypothetical protein